LSGGRGFFFVITSARAQQPKAQKRAADPYIFVLSHSSDLFLRAEPSLTPRAQSGRTLVRNFEH
jgi:hypothetical protein